MDRVILAWSGGKDSAIALRVLRNDGVDVEALLTTIASDYDRSSIHGVRRVLYERQAAALELSLHAVELPPEPSNEQYETAMADALGRYDPTVLDGVGFGDLFLEEVRDYREDRLAGTGFAGYWPLWGEDTAALASRFIDAGFEATLVAVDGRELDASFAGRRFDHRLLDELPADVDPCGEHGEFHTFVHGGPGFAEPVPLEVGETVTRNVADSPVHYADLVPTGTPPEP